MTGPLHVTVDGPAGAPVLVLGSSVGSTSAMWEPQVAALAERFRLVRYDHPGHGGSAVVPRDYTLADLGRAVLATLDALGVGRAHHGGLSLGGMVAMWLAAHAPERVDRVALVCTSAHLPPRQMWQDRAAAVRSGGMAAVSDTVLDRWFTPAFRDTRPDVVERHRAMLLSVDVDGYAGCCAAIAGMDLRGDLGRVSAATLVVAGSADLATPSEHAREIAGRVPGARVAVVDDAAHIANVERPAQVTALLLEHLVGTEGPGDGRRAAA